MKTVALIATLVLIGLAASQENAPKLIAHKEILNNLIFQNKNLNVKYSIYNVGSGSAFNVELLDNSFAMSDFKIAAGLTKVKYDRIAPGSNVSHSVVLIPQNPGRVNFTYAQVSYSSQQQQGKGVQIGYTSAPGEMIIYSMGDYERFFTSHVMDWLYFAGMTLPCILLPGLFWYRSYAHYCSSAPTSKSTKSKSS